MFLLQKICSDHWPISWLATLLLVWGGGVFNLCSSLGSLDTRHLSETLLVEVFSLSVCCSGYSADSFFCCARAFNFIEFHCQVLGLFPALLEFYSKICCLYLCQVFPCVSLSSFRFSSFELRFLSWFELMWRGMDLISFLCTCTPRFANSVSWKDKSTDILFEMCFCEGTEK